jgi:hypothetical protein
LFLFILSITFEFVIMFGGREGRFESVLEKLNKKSKLVWARLLSASSAHWRAPALRDPVTACHRPINTTTTATITSSLQGANHPRVTPRHHPIPVPLALHIEAPHASTLLFPLCSCHCFTTDVTTGKPHLSLVGHHREHLPHSFLCLSRTQP